MSDKSKPEEDMEHVSRAFHRLSQESQGLPPAALEALDDLQRAKDVALDAHADVFINNLLYALRPDLGGVLPPAVREDLRRALRNLLDEVRRP